jgi:hypothetical protein
VEDSTKQPDILSELEAESVPLLFNVPIGLSSRYAHQLVTQTSENEVALFFFEVLPPFLTGGTIEEQKEILKKGVRADCVARVTIARARFPEFVKAMIGQLTPEQKKDICT